MVTIDTEEAASFEIRKTFAAPRERVFRAWTEAAAIKQWFPPPGYEAAPTDIDLREGGTFRWGLRKLPDGEVFWATGTFVEVEAPHRLSCTWQWSGTSDPRPTRITVDFHERQGRTEVVFRHDRFHDLEMRNKHQQGWTHCFKQLMDYLQKEENKR